MNSTHKVEVVPVVVARPHPNADRLGIITVFGGYDCVINLADWQGVKLAAYIPPDNMVDTLRPEFSFLMKDAKADGKARIRARKIRGVTSFGLLVPAPPGSQEGDDVTAALGVEHYTPGESNATGRKLLSGEAATPPGILIPEYGLESLRRYPHLIPEGTPVQLTEKLDGSNARYVYHEGQYYCGSHYSWKKEFLPTVTVEDLLSRGVDAERAAALCGEKKAPALSSFWAPLRAYPGLAEFLKMNPDWVVFGEIYGNTNCIKYGFSRDPIMGINRFAAFECYHPIHGWMLGTSFQQVMQKAGIPTAPVIADSVPYSFDSVKVHADGPTLAPDSSPGVIREGVVVTPVNQYVDSRFGRLKLKCVGDEFSTRYR